MIDVNVDEVIALKRRLDEINAIPLEQVRWVDGDGKPFDVPEGNVKEFQFAGLTNIYFVLDEFHTTPWQKAWSEHGLKDVYNNG